MLPIIVVSVIATVIAIALYVLMIKKHYWGPNGPPKKNGQNKERRQR